MLSQEFIKKMKTRLEEEKKQVEEKIADLEKPEQPMDNPDLDDLAHDATDDILEENLLKIHKDILEKIDNALFRIKDGSYGKCLICGTEISQDDLEKEPWAEHCRSCEK